MTYNPTILINTNHVDGRPSYRVHDDSVRPVRRDYSFKMNDERLTVADVNPDHAGHVLEFEDGRIVTLDRVLEVGAQRALESGRIQQARLMEGPLLGQTIWLIQTTHLNSDPVPVAHFTVNPDGRIYRVHPAGRPVNVNADFPGVELQDAPLTSHSVVLNLFQLDAGENLVLFTDATEDDGAENVYTTGLDTWNDLGQPTQVTITVEPGDQLN